MMVPLVPAYNIRRLVTLERMPHNAAVRPERRDCSKKRRRIRAKSTTKMTGVPQRRSNQRPNRHCSRFP